MSSSVFWQVIGQAGQDPEYLWCSCRSIKYNSFQTDQFGKMSSLVMMKIAENTQNTALASRERPIYTITLASCIGR